jgi:glycosyltransferase involved in cell wall biosynthesis
MRDLRATVCIPTRNRADLLQQTLESLNRQTVAPQHLQVVVGDDGSTDGTLDMVRRMPARYELIWTQVSGRGSAAARNAASRLARNEVLIFLDDDQVASPWLVASHLEVHRRCGVVLVQGDYPLAGDCDRHGAALILERARKQTFGLENATAPVAFHLWGGNFSVRRETWARVGGFDENLPRSQDLDFGIGVADLGVPIKIESGALSHHLHRVSRAQFRHQNFTAGRCSVRISRKRQLSMESILCSPVDRPVDKLLKLLWRRWPRAADVAGRGLSSALWGADALRLRWAQLLASRLVRRFYELGGISMETASQVPPRALA